MKRIIPVLILIFISSKIFAAVSGEGSLEFVFTEGTLIKSISYDYSDRYFGTFSRYDSFSNIWSYPWSPFGDVYLDQDYQGTASDISSMLNASWNSGNGSAELSFIADSIDPGNLNEDIFADLSGVILLGSYITLPSFLYYYNFLGQIDSAEDTIHFSVQTEIGYGATIFYTDYDKNHPSYRTNWVCLDTTDSNGTINEDGYIYFPSFVSADGLPKDWFIRYNFTAGGYDSAGAPVPEPSLLILYVLGIVTGVAKLKTATKV